ncbi:MAG: Esterase PHB depolymerase [bacterium ADurb.Bin243]|nr:MAG: Esterase PHB depolymerase [bacterium ADurb.Bin243]HOD39791.1 PHB depolymerase family esterase [Candidatus Wallbacteria bacterium]
MKLKKTMLVLSAIVLSLVFISKCHSFEGEKAVLTVDGVERSYIVYQGQARDKKIAAPLLVVLHGGGGNGARMQKLCGFDAIAAREGFVTAYPDALKNNWNDERGDFKSYAHQNRIDDVKFLSQMIDSISSSHNIDKNRVYLAGVSNGGMMSHLFAMRKGDKIAAMAAVITSIPHTLKNEKPVRALPVLMMNGDKDKLVKWEGGVVANNRGSVISARDSVKFWAENNGCAKTPEVIKLPDKAPGDGVTVEKEIYKSAPENKAGVVFYILHGGGHSWPGKKFGPLYKWIITRDGEGGNACMDINAADEIWSFFKDKKLNAK